MTHGTPFVAAGAVVAGWPAHVVDRLLARHAPAVVGAFAPEQRAAFDATRDAIRRAALAWETAGGARSRTDEPPPVPAGSDSMLMDSHQVAERLGIGVRAVQKRAATGSLPGRKIAGAWLFDPLTVDAKKAAA